MGCLESSEVAIWGTSLWCSFESPILSATGAVALEPRPGRSSLGPLWVGIFNSLSVMEAYHVESE